MKQFTCTGFVERRIFNRMSVECPIDYSFANGDSRGDGTTRNLSASGILFTTDVELQVGSSLVVNMEPEVLVVPPLRALVDVVRSEESEPGEFHISVTMREIMQTE